MAGLAGFAAPAPRAQAQDALKVCLNEDLPPYSTRRGNSGSGFDVLVAQAIAERLGRPVAVQWFESKLDNDSSAALEANALLSDGLCQLVGGYPLLKDALGQPGVETARLPDFEGAKPADRRRRVRLGALVPSRAYHFAPLTVVLGGAAAGKEITGLGDLEGLRLGAEGGTLADAVLMLFGGGRLIDRITHLVPGRGELLPRLESGDYEATLVELRRFDAYRAAHPDTKLRASGYYYRIGFNLGFVALAADAALIEPVNRAIGELLDEGKLTPLARAAGMTFLPPRPPEILENFTLVDLAR